MIMEDKLKNVFHEVREGETFIIPADCNYQIRTYGIVEYMCDYVVES